jgi:DedD protein
MEKKKLLLVVVSVGVFLIIVVGASLVVFTAKKPSPLVLDAKSSVIAPGTPGSSQTVAPPSPGTAGGTSGVNGGNTEGPATAPLAGPNGGDRAPASVDASEWVRNPKSVPGLQAPAPGSSSTRGDVIIIYGDKGAQVAPTFGAGSTGSPETGTVIEVPKPATPTVPEPVSPAATTNGSPSSTNSAPNTGTNGVVTQTTKRTLTMESTTTTVKGSSSTTAKKPATKAEPVKTTGQAVYEDYWIQTGAFSTKNLAESAKEALSRKGIPSFVEIKTINDKTYYRVRVGPYTSKKEADYWLSLVKGLDGFDKSYISMVKNRR